MSYGKSSNILHRFVPIEGLDWKYGKEGNKRLNIILFITSIISLEYGSY
jgi:hypothetical protein